MPEQGEPPSPRASHARDRRRRLSLPGRGPYVGPFHWDSPRLRVPEVKRLFTFPDEFRFVGNRQSVQAQLGNSVPPLLARKVAAEVAAVL